jgi:hypothetical protein
MAKTRRTKHNGKAPLKSRNVNLIKLGSLPLVAKPGRSPASARAEIDVQVFSGINRGKKYPYASAKRSGRAVPDFRLRPRDTVATV